MTQNLEECYKNVRNVTSMIWTTKLYSALLLFSTTWKKNMLISSFFWFFYIVMFLTTWATDQNQIFLGIEKSFHMFRKMCLAQLWMFNTLLYKRKMFTSWLFFCLDILFLLNFMIHKCLYIVLITMFKRLFC